MTIFGSSSFNFISHTHKDITVYRGGPNSPEPSLKMLRELSFIHNDLVLFELLMGAEICFTMTPSEHFAAKCVKSESYLM